MKFRKGDLLVFDMGHHHTMARVDDILGTSAGAENIVVTVVTEGGKVSTLLTDSRWVRLNLTQRLGWDKAGREFTVKEQDQQTPYNVFIGGDVLAEVVSAIRRYPGRKVPPIKILRGMDPKPSLGACKAIVEEIMNEMRDDSDDR